MELADYAIIITFTTLLTTASTTVLLYNMRTRLEKDICNKITDLLVRVGVLEAKHRKD
jgi:hypothetical protein